MSDNKKNLRGKKTNDNEKSSEDLSSQHSHEEVDPCTRHAHLSIFNTTNLQHGAKMIQ